MRKRLAGSMVVAVVAAFAAPAFAETTFQYEGYRVVDPIAVSVADAALGVNESGIAGQVQLFGAGPDFGRTLDVWCIDLLDLLQPGGTYAFRSPTSTPLVLTAAQVSEIGGLIRWGDANIHTNGYAAAAAQIAIWEIAFGADLTVTGDAVGYADQLAEAARSGAIPGAGWAALVPLDGSNQYMATAPEPATWAMMLVGFAGLGCAAFQRRGKRAPVA